MNYFQVVQVFVRIPSWLSFRSAPTTLDQLSQRSGVDVGTISALETRESCRSKFAPDLARALRLSLDQFLDERYDFLPQLKMGAIPAPIGAHSGGKVSHWPFEDITPEQWHRLDDNERGRIEAYARGSWTPSGPLEKAYRRGWGSSQLLQGRRQASPSH